jgi:hypothetical protein
MFEGLIVYIAALQTIQFIALMTVLNRLTSKPVATKVAIYIDGKKGRHMQILKADKTYKIEVRGEDKDGNPVALDPAMAQEFTLSSEEMGTITQESDGSFTLDPNKVGPVSLQGKVGEIVGILECEIIAGDLFKLGVSVSERA